MTSSSPFGRHRRDPKKTRAQIVELLTKHPQGMTIEAIAARLGASKSLASRYLKLMRAEGILKRAKGWAGGWVAATYTLKVAKAPEASTGEPTGEPTGASTG